MQFKDMLEFSNAVMGELKGQGKISDVEFITVYSRNNIAFLTDQGQGIRDLVYKNVPALLKHFAKDKSGLNVTDYLTRAVKKKGHDWLPVVPFRPDQNGAPDVFLEKINSLNLGRDTISPALYWKATIEAYTYLHIQWVSFYHLYPFFLGGHDDYTSLIEDRIQMVTFQELIENEDWTKLWAKKMNNFNPFIVNIPK